MSRTSPSSNSPGNLPHTRRNPLSNGFILQVLLLTGLALGLRAWRLGSQSLWFDETFTVFIARKPWLEGLRILVADGVHPPLFYWIEKIFLSLGQREALVRLPAMLFGVLSVPLLAALAYPWVGQRTALWAALLYALAPFHIFPCALRGAMKRVAR
ncbi:MAG TPA: glycosyltransferase family 39 protein [Anaerolineae bacterium]|nr:glycosyltransferase family 39 protein [Anaerolineae bacterium]